MAVVSGYQFFLLTVNADDAAKAARSLKYSVGVVRCFLYCNEPIKDQAACLELNLAFVSMFDFRRS